MVINIFDLKGDEKGQAMVEYALVLPIFLMILMFTIDVGWLIYQKSMFDYTCRNSAWELRLSQDEDWVMNNGIEIIHSGRYANDLLSQQFKEVDRDGKFKIDMNKVSFANGKIGIYPGEKEYKYKRPGSIPDDVVVHTDLKFKTVTMEIEGKIEYQVYALTPLTKPFFKDGIKLTNNLYKAKKTTMRRVRWPT